jgi:enhancing lycopene biosynthesis protein 2
MKDKKRFAVVLSGCGVYDGAEIHEATLALYAIMNNGAEYDVFAPDIEHHHVINHMTGEEMNESRNVLVESARIARGNIKTLGDYHPGDYDILLFPGGFGAAKNLSSFAFKGAELSVDRTVESVVHRTREAGKPIGALCVAPVILAKLLPGVKLTIGQDDGATEAVQKMGAVHESTTHGEVVIDEKLKVATTPCYMLDANILQIAEGADNIVKVLLKM